MSEAQGSEHKGGDFLSRAGEVANQLKGKAGELASNPKVAEGTEKATEAAEKAATAAAHQVAPLAGKLKSLTKGRWDKQIDSVSGKLEHTLDRSGGDSKDDPKTPDGP